MSRDGLTQQQFNFVLRIFAGEGVRDAAIGAGAKPKSAAVTGSKWLRMAKVQAKLAELRKPIEQAAIADAEKIARRWTGMVDHSLADFLDENGNLRPEAFRNRDAVKALRKMRITERVLKPKEGGEDEDSGEEVLERRIELEMNCPIRAGQAIADLQGYGKADKGSERVADAIDSLRETLIPLKKASG